jgi:pyridoxal phosphate enzyme (YggS family)
MVDDPDIGPDIDPDSRVDIDAVRSRVLDLRARIDAIERPWSHRVAVVGVTKGFGADAIDAAVLGGCDAIGENYAQELIDKRPAIERLQPVVHFIGRLQRNKVRHLAGLVDLWCSLDRASVIDEVAKRAPGAHVLVQVDTTGDPAKGGCGVDDVAGLVDRATSTGLVVEGLMTVGPTGQDSEAARTGFREVRALVDRLGLAECSMGMSADLEVAVDEGSTQVRVGTALFGPRPLRRLGRAEG